MQLEKLRQLTEHIRARISKEFKDHKASDCRVIFIVQEDKTLNVFVIEQKQEMNERKFELYTQQNVLKLPDAAIWPIDYAGKNNIIFFKYFIQVLEGLYEALDQGALNMTVPLAKQLEKICEHYDYSEPPKKIFSSELFKTPDSPKPLRAFEDKSNSSSWVKAREPGSSFY